MLRDLFIKSVAQLNLFDETAMRAKSEALMSLKKASTLCIPRPHRTRMTHFNSSLSPKKAITPPLSLSINLRYLM